MEPNHKLRGANMDIDLATPPGAITWTQDRCPWNAAEGADVHRCAVKSTSICSHFGGIEALDTVLCSYPAASPAYEIRRDRYAISTDRARLDVDAIHAYLSERSYWAEGRPRELVERSIENSLCFGVYDGEAQAGFARVVTDYALFAWLCDVFILEDYRGRGLGKWLVESVVGHPVLANIRRIYLATFDAHELYRRYGGFETLPGPEYWMVRRLE
jgi:GNAT superfamily N-acetyltransferase